jgi:hypothetical protein
MFAISRAHLRRGLPLSALLAFPLFLWVAPSPWLTASIRVWDLAGASHATPPDTELTIFTAPADRLEGLAAKQGVVELLDQALARLERITGYTATVRLQERVRGVLGSEQRLEMKLRHSPFAVYLKSLAPVMGREAIYAHGQNENKMVAHQVDWTRHLTPRLMLSPTHPLVLAYSRHPITESGLAHMAQSLRKAARLDLDDDGAVTVLTRVTDADGRAWLRSTHQYARPAPGRSFARVEVLYDPTTSLPLRMCGYDWPERGAAGEPLLAEHCAFDDLKIDVPMSDRDFDPDNPAYDFNPRRSHP